MYHLYQNILVIGLLSSLAVGAQTVDDSYQTEGTEARISLTGAVATGDYTPFWQQANRYGIAPTEANQAYLQAGVFHQQSFGQGFSWGAGLDLVAVTPRYRNAYIHQLYAELGYRQIRLSVGSREQRSAFGLDSRLSSGDVIYSTNARPLPEIRLSMPNYTTVPFTREWLQLKWDFAVGRSLDNAYLKDWTQGKQIYVEDVLWHHKALHFRLADAEKRLPIVAEIGVQHIAQWGGTSTNPKVGTQPHSFKDFLRIVSGQHGGNDATLSDQINVLGSHHISYDFRLGWEQETWQIQGYYQHLCYDKSGLEFDNGTDGLWGIQLDLSQGSWLRRLVVEYFTTLNASGPFHFIHFDHTEHPGRGGGGDNYYNNEEYVGGLSYFNQSVGSPLLPSPIYNQDGKLGFRNNRVRAWHLGVEGNLSPQLSYRVLLSMMQGWGTTFRPFTERRSTVAPLLEVSYTHPRFEDWQFTASMAGNSGDMLGDSTYGFGLCITKRFQFK